MLYDKRWDAKVETKADPLTLESLIAWLEKQPADRQYCYSDSGRCLAALYNKSIDRAYKTPAPWDVFRPDALFDGVLERIAVGNNKYTFGAALERARAELAKRPATTAGDR